MIRKVIFILIGIVVAIYSVTAQQERKYIRKGNKAYNTQKYNKAEILYRKALEKENNSFGAKFNIGDALYKQGKYQEAAQQFQTIVPLAKEKEQKAKVFHNMGNAFLQAYQQMAQADTNGFLQKSIDAYKMALKNNSSDMDTKYNLSYALKILKKQQQNKKNNKQQQNKDNKQQEKKDQQKKQDKNKQQQQNKQQKEQNQKEQNQKQQDQMSKENAERLLKALQQNENKLQEKLKKQKGQKIKMEKDW